jgi:ornithine cyclodeaminase
VRARVIGRREVEQLVSPSQALEAVRIGFAAFDAGQAVASPALDLPMPAHHGELHVKGGHLHDSPFFSVKTATGFYANPARGLPVADGMTLVYDAETGELLVVVADGGLLTDLRTAAAGALAAESLAKMTLKTVTIVGAGGQARYQLSALLEVRTPERIRIWARRQEQALEYAAWANKCHGLCIDIAVELPGAVRESDLIVTTTPSTQPLIAAEWLRPGVHVTAMGSDMPEKRELGGEVLSRADKIVCDSVASCLRSGELHHAVAEQSVTESHVWAELGAIVRGRVAGRTAPDEITVADLTGLGVQDAAIADLVAESVLSQRMGWELIS